MSTFKTLAGMLKLLSFVPDNTILYLQGTRAAVQSQCPPAPTSSGLPGDDGVPSPASLVASSEGGSCGTFQASKSSNCCIFRLQRGGEGGQGKLPLEATYVMVEPSTLEGAQITQLLLLLLLLVKGCPLGGPLTL